MPEYISTGEILLYSVTRFWPSIFAIIATLMLCYPIRDRLGVFGRLYGSRIGMAGLVIVLFWIFTALFADIIAVMGKWEQSFSPGMKKGLPGVIDTQNDIIFLWGGDNLARDIFSRVVHGSRIVLIVAPAATLIAYMVGATLGLPAGYYRGWIDSGSSFLANLILAFPVILLFYLLVTPEVQQSVPVNIGPFVIPWSIPIGMAAAFLLFPIVFLCMMWFTKHEKAPMRMWSYLGVTLIVGFWLYGGLVFGLDIVKGFGSGFLSAAQIEAVPGLLVFITLIVCIYVPIPNRPTRHLEAGIAAIVCWAYYGPVFGGSPLNAIQLAPNQLNIFAAVILGSSPGVFRIVRGLTMDIMTRDYVAAAQTRGERPWYIMLWEILPNARGPLIVDFCLRIGYTTILLGTLGFFGLGLAPESPDWGSMINHGRPFVRLAATAHLALFPALALMSLVLGLNLLADGLREDHSRIKEDAMTEPILEIEDLNISFYTRAGEIPAVMDFSMTVMPGETMGLVGESGCGKSTVSLGIMRYLGNNGHIKSGKIKFMGRDMAEMSNEELRELRGSKISMVYQEPMASLNPAMKIGRQLSEVLTVHEGITEQEALKRAAEMVSAVRLPDPDRILGAYPHQLSGGQQQRVVISMALLSKPQLLLLDEPTTALDVTVEAGIVSLIGDLAREFGTSMIFVSHNLGLILETCDRITVMYSGEAVEEGAIDTVFNNMRHPYTKGLLRSIPVPGADKYSRPLVAIPGQLPLPHERPVGCNFGPRCDYFNEEKCNMGLVPMHSVGDRHRSRCERIDEIDWSADAVAGEIDEPIIPGEVVLTVDKLKKHYSVSTGMFGGGDTRTVKANEALTFDAREAETVAIVGESGCGKSTFAKVLMGLETATDGTVTLGELEIAHLPVEKRGPKTVSQVQMVFQNPFDTLNPSMTVGSQILRVLEMFEIGDSDADRKERMLDLLDLVKLPREFATRMPRQLSGGQKQRIGIARAFAGRPKLVVADEPVSALDVSVQAAVTKLLTDIQRESRTTMLFISHDLGVVRYLADRVVVMYLGEIMEQGNTEDIFAPPYHPYTEALLSAVPVADTHVKKRHVVLEGEIPSPLNRPNGCPFQTRCQYFMPGTCDVKELPHKHMGNGHFIACHMSDEDLRAMLPVIEVEAAPAAE